MSSRELGTVMFVDIVDSTRRLAAVGDAAWAKILDAFEALLRDTVEAGGGRVVNFMGDGALMLLRTPTDAAVCARALHDSAPDLGLSLRAGVHCGEVQLRGDDVSGLAVHVAARLVATAAPGETLVSETVTMLAAAPDGYVRRGRQVFKGISEPVMVFAASSPTPLVPAASPDESSSAASVASMLADQEFEAAATAAPAVTDTGGLADAVLDAESRAEFLDIDLTLVRLIESTLERLPDDELARRSRLEAKLAFELRGDPTALGQRRELLAAAADHASSAGDERALADALLAQLHALIEPSTAPDRLAAAERAISLTRRCGSAERELVARLARVDILFELGRVLDAELELATYERLSRPLGQLAPQAFVASRRAVIGSIRGRYDDVEHEGRIAYEAAVAAGMADAERLRLACNASRARDQADISVLEEAIERLRDLTVRLPGHYIDATAARCLLEVGRTDEARAELERALPGLLTSRGYRWLGAACDVAIVAAAVGSARACAQLRQALEASGGRFVVTGPTFGGSIHQYIGALAARLGDLESAERSYRSAIDDLDAIAALPWAARARLGLADVQRRRGEEAAAAEVEAEAMATARAIGMTAVLAALETGPGPPSAWSLRREADGWWTLAAGHERARLPDARGLGLLRTLLANPGKEIAAVDLDGGSIDVARPGGVDVLDHQAKRSYRARLAELDDEMDAADRCGDDQGAARIAAEREHLIAQLRGALGLGGRDRHMGDTSERVRINVTRNLRRAIDRVAEAAPLAGAHLAASIRTGNYCRYQPQPGGPAHWST